MVELAVVGFLCIHLDFLVEVVVLVEGCWWVWIFDSFGFFGGGGGCGCVEGYWWWRLWLWLWVSGFLPLVVVELGLGVSATLHFMGFLMGEYERG